MKDLEIRGAGDLLGGEQSGFINDIGFDTYQKILNKAIDELKANEFKELYQEENQNEEKVFVKDAQIDTDFEILFPDDYINNITERLNLYTKLNQLKNEEELRAFENELKDRFGDLPIQVIDLLNSLRIKWIAASIGLEKIVMKQAKMIGYFIADQHSVFYQSKRFSEALQTVQQHPHVCRMKEKQTRNGLRLLLVFDQVKNLATGLERLQIFEATEEAR